MRGRTKLDTQLRALAKKHDLNLQSLALHIALSLPCGCNAAGTCTPCRCRAYKADLWKLLGVGEEKKSA